MPYTPPSHHSPASSAASSPDTSRRPSFHASKPTLSISSPAPHSTLPRSSSYLTRHRRTPSAVSTSSSSTGQPTPRSTNEDLAGMVSVAKHSHDSIRQSPPPMTGDRQGMPTGAVISPPDSPPSSDDEDQETRGRRIENMKELKQLHDAISQLPHQRRASSPSEPADLGALVAQPLQATASATDGMRHSFSTGSLDQFTRLSSMVARSSSSGSSSRRVSHVRSATEPNIPATPSMSSLTGSDEENDLEILKKPQMVRKKSGELVRPALRLGARRRPSSMPGTPTFSKVVHFDSHLEHVRHFLQVDRPLAVSAGSSPAENYDSETEYPFGNTDGNSKKQTHRTPPFEWEIILTKFPVETPARKEQAVRLERVWLSSDQKFLHGSIAALNLAFSKSVVCRFTLDYWKTTSEIAAEYCAEILPRTAPQGHDRFNFTIKLSDLANLESKTMYFCIRYNVDGKEFWDNNNGNNFQLDFKKKMLPINGKNGLQNSALPRSHRRVNPSAAPRPISMPISLDDFDDGSKVMFDQSVHEYLGESEHPALRLKTSQSALSLPSDNLTGRLSNPSGQAFANRYDFGASLTAAVQAAKDVLTNKRDGLYMKSGRKSSPVSTSPAAAGNTTATPVNTEKRSIAFNATQEPTTVSLPIAGLDRDSRAILTESGVYGPGSIASKSYEEIVSKYCFYVPKPNMPSKETVSQSGQQSGQTDGPAGEVATQQNQTSPSSTITSDGSPVQIGGFYLHGQQQQQQSRPRWYEVPSRDSSSSSIQSFGTAYSVMSTGTTGHDSSDHQRQPRRGTPLPEGGLSNVDGSGSTTSSSSSSPASPASIVGGFPPLSDLSYLKDRFPFNNADGHSTPAIRG